MQEYEELCNKVREINEEAYQYMICDAKKLPGFFESDTLLGCFIWSDSPQGFYFWNEISENLGE